MLKQAEIGNLYLFSNIDIGSKDVQASRDQPYLPRQQHRHWCERCLGKQISAVFNQIATSTLMRSIDVVASRYQQYLPIYSKLVIGAKYVDENKDQQSLSR